LNVALRLSDGIAVLLFLSGAFTLTIWLGGLLVFGLVQAWRTRQTLKVALKWVMCPLVVLFTLGLAIWLIWAAFGLLPWQAIASSDLAPVASLTSPDGKWRAAYVEDLSGGPMTGTGEDVYIVRQGSRKLFFKDRVFSAECIQDMSIRWIGARTLQIDYSTGDSPLVDGLQRGGNIPWFHGQDDEEKRIDPVHVVQVRHVLRGGFC
jgi:hypothetical protein